MKSSSAYAANARWLAMFAPFRALSLSAAYLTPFFLGKGLDLTGIFLLQSIFSLVCVLWELPSGMLADRLGRVTSIRLSAPLAGVAMTAYGFSSHYWQFVVCEILLALASGMFNGADKALLFDSLRADLIHEHGAKALDEQLLKKQYQARTRRIKAGAFGVIFLAAPIAALLVYFFGVTAVIVADGLLLLAGSAFAWRLVEAPYRHHPNVQEAEKELLTSWQAIKQLGGQPQIRWLVFLGVILSTSTYLAAWAAAPYYQSVGVPLALFGAVFAVRSLLKAILAYRYSGDAGGIEEGSGLTAVGGRWRRMLRHKFFRKQSESRAMWTYVGLAGGGYLVMASGQWWLLPFILGHDVVHALHDDPISARLNESMDARHRATLNSTSNLFSRLSYAIGGPVAGLLVGWAGLRMGLLYVGVICGGLASLAMLRLQRLAIFK